MWDERYSTPNYIFGTEPCRWLLMNQDRLPTEGRALSIGDGEGRNGVYLAGLGLETLSVDLSEVGLQKARELATGKAVSLATLQADLADYEPEPGAFDVVCSIYTHLPSPVRETVHARCERALKPGGLFILEAYHQSQVNYGTGGPKAIDLLYSRDTLLSDFKQMDVLDALDGLSHLDEGDRHQGLGHIVRLVLQKR